MLNSEKIRHDDVTDLSISPVRCSHFTLSWEIQKSHFQQYYSLLFSVIILGKKSIRNSN